MAVTQLDLYAFGNRRRPRPPRLNIDVFPNATGTLGPEDPKDPQGASTVADPYQSPLSGHYHRLPAGSILPEGLDVVADGSDVRSGSKHGRTHHTIFPTVAMAIDQFVELYNNLPWKYAGEK